MDKQDLLKRFQSPDEKLLFSKVLDRFFLCQSQCVRTFTFFLDPIHTVRFLEILRPFEDEKILAYGGASGSERKMLGFAPAYQDFDYSHFPIDRLSIGFQQKFGARLSHRDFLGSITGLGINREKIGDINVTPGNAEVYVNRDISGYLCANLIQVGRVKVSAEVKKAEGAFWDGWQELKPDDRREMLINVSSPRLDAVISAAFNVSRADSAKLVRGGKVYVNWGLVSQNEKGIKEGDIITVRGFGRARVNEIRPLKSRYAVHVDKYK